MQKQTLLFNLDDTLVHCNKYFRDTINAFVAQLQEWFEKLTKEEIKQKQLEIDLKVSKSMAFTLPVFQNH